MTCSKNNSWLLGIVSLFFLLGCVNPQPTPVPTEPSPRIQPDETMSERIERAATATPVIVPTNTTRPVATIDATIADWTLLVYMDADNNLEPYALTDLEEIASSAASVSSINVVVQVDRSDGYVISDIDDWSDTRRFAVQAGEWVELGSIGEIEMGEPDQLASFISWGLNEYPARQTALVMWGHGSGWLGTAGLSISNLEAALSAGLADSEHEQFELIGFDACLMGQLDVFAAVQSYATVAVASEDLIPGNGWDYAGLLQQMAAQAVSDGAQLGQVIVDSYQTRYAVDGVNDVTLAAVDLRKIDAVTEAADALADVLLTDLAVHAPIVGDGRQGSGQIASKFGKGQDAVGAIDFGRFSAILAQISPDPTLRASAQAAVVAVENAVIANNHGSEIEFAEGIALYFPQRAAYNSDYVSAAATDQWNSLLTAYHDLELPAPNLSIVSAPDTETVINAQNPAFLAFELEGRQVGEVALLIGRYLPDGRQLLLEYDRLIPEPTTLPDGTQLNTWRDGFHSDFFVWDTEVTYLTDGTAGEFVIMWPTAPDSTHFAVQGLYSFANGSDSVAATLLFDHKTESLVAVWGGDVRTPAQILPQQGDQFMPYQWYVDEAGAFVPEAAVTLDVNALTYDNQPVDEGNYFMGFRAESLTGEQSEAMVDLTLATDDAAGDYNGYLDPYLGFQFLYPDEWIRPIYGEYGSTLLYTSDVSGTVSFQVKLYQSDELAVGEQATPLSAEAIRADALNQWENISLLYDDTTTVAGEIATETVYGYLTETEQRTGIFYTFVRDGAGYLVDIDMPTVDEALLLETAQVLVDSWVFQQVGVGLDQARWETLILPDKELLIPAGYVYEPLENGWQRYRRSQRVNTFFAFRRDELTGRNSAELAAAWVSLASSGLTDISVEQPVPFPLAGRSWVRYDFTYTGDDGTPIAGFLLTSLTDEESVLWAESPADEWNRYAETVLLLASREFRQK